MAAMEGGRIKTKSTEVNNEQRAIKEQKGESNLMRRELIPVKKKTQDDGKCMRKVVIVDRMNLRIFLRKKSSNWIIANIERAIIQLWCQPEKKSVIITQ